MEDKMIEVSGKKYSLRKILDDDTAWQKYVTGSTIFKECIELGVTIQIIQLHNAERSLEEAKARLKNI